MTSKYTVTGVKGFACANAATPTRAIAFEAVIAFKNQRVLKIEDGANPTMLAARLPHSRMPQDPTNILCALGGSWVRKATIPAAQKKWCANNAAFLRRMSHIKSLQL